MRSRGATGAALCGVVLLLAPAAAQAALLADAWYSSIILGKRVGWVHEMRETDVEGGRKVVRTNLETEFTIRRMGTEISVLSKAVFVETDSGEPLHFESTNKFAQNDYSIRAERRGDAFLVTQEAMGKKTETEVPYTPDILFPNRVEAEIAARGLAPGAHLELKTFSPDAARPTRMTVDCKDWEDVELEDGRHEKLLRLESAQDTMPGVQLIEWRNAKGEAQKTLLPILGLDILSYRTTREKALLDPEGVELLVSTLVDPDAVLPHARAITKATFKLTLRKADPTATIALPEDQLQRVVGRDVGSVVVEVKSESWERPKEFVRPDRRYLAANSALQSDDPKVREAALKAAPRGASPEAAAKSITRWVYRSIDKKSLSVGLATAAEVARDLTGDCTEHAVLAAALLRAHNIPSKVAMGLVYLDGRFGYHMWTEAFDGGWHAIDPTFGEEGVDATHIKLAESPLDQGFVDDNLIGLVRLIANLDVKVVRYEIDGVVRTPVGAAEVGTLHDGLYENSAFGIRVPAPKGWRLLPRAPGADHGQLVRLEGPNGAVGEVRATSVSYDFHLQDWIDAAHHGDTVRKRQAISVGDRPGLKYVFDGKGGREGLAAFLDRDTLFTVSLSPLGPRGELTLDKLVGSIQVK